MAKTISFTYKEKDYLLEFTNKTVKQMSLNGFRVGDLEDNPIVALPDLFAGAFLAHHRYVKRELIDEIYANMTDKEALLANLGEMYAEPIKALTDEPEDESKKVMWEVIG